MTIECLQPEDLTDALQQQVSDLFTQLNPDRQQVALSRILDRDNPVVVACAREGSQLIGIALMGCYAVVSGRKGWVEDVVVDVKERGKGTGRKLMEKLLETAAELGLTEVLLFTADHREPAIRLYRSLGFEPKGSRIYHLKR